MPRCWQYSRRVNPLCSYPLIIAAISSALRPRLRSWLAMLLSQQLRTAGLNRGSPDAYVVQLHSLVIEHRSVGIADFDQQGRGHVRHAEDRGVADVGLEILVE